MCSVVPKHLGDADHELGRFERVQIRVNRAEWCRQEGLRLVLRAEIDLALAEKLPILRF